MGTTAALAIANNPSPPPETPTAAELDLIANLPTPPETTAHALAVNADPPTAPEMLTADSLETTPDAALAMTDNPSTPQEMAAAATAVDLNASLNVTRSICPLANSADSDTSTARSVSRPTTLDIGNVVLSNNTGDGDLTLEDSLTVRRILTPLPLYKHRRQSLKKFTRIPEPRTLEQFLPLEMFICKLCLMKINNPQENLFVFTCRHAYHFHCATSLCMSNADCRSCLYPNRDDQYRLLQLIPYSLYMERLCNS